MINKTSTPVISVLIIALLFLSGPMFSKGKPIKFGLRAGINLANVSNEIRLADADAGDENPGLKVNLDNNIRKTYGIGGFVEYSFSSMISAQLNVLYNLKGVKVNTTVEGPFFVQEIGMLVNIFQETKQTIEYSYLSVPILGKLTLGREGSTRPYIIFGPEVGFLLSAKTSSLKGDVQAYIPGVAGGAQSISAPGQDIKNDTESMEIALNFGTGIIFPLRSMNTFLDARYGYGLSETNKAGDAKITNNVIYVSFGVIF